MRSAWRRGHRGRAYLGRPAAAGGSGGGRGDRAEMGEIGSNRIG
jgi:hypothetical protein